MLHTHEVTSSILVSSTFFGSLLIRGRKFGRVVKAVALGAILVRGRGSNPLACNFFCTSFLSTGGYVYIFVTVYDRRWWCANESTTALGTIKITKGGVLVASIQVRRVHEHSWPSG